MKMFTFVYATSSYNVILENLTMNDFRDVNLTYHQKIKFLVGNQVGEVRGDHLSSRKCYIKTVHVDKKKAKREGQGERVEVFSVDEARAVIREEHEEVEVVPGQPGKVTKVARDLELPIWSKILVCLQIMQMFLLGNPQNWLGSHRMLLSIKISS